MVEWPATDKATVFDPPKKEAKERGYTAKKAKQE
jgi:hypothetical protein